MPVFGQLQDVLKSFPHAVLDQLLLGLLQLAELLDERVHDSQAAKTGEIQANRSGRFFR